MFPHSSVGWGRANFKRYGGTCAETDQAETDLPGPRTLSLTHRTQARMQSARAPRQPEACRRIASSSARMSGLLKWRVSLEVHDS